MNQYAIRDLSGFRLKLMMKLEETITKYQEIVKRLNAIPKQDSILSHSVNGRPRQANLTERERLSTRATRLRKYLNCITNALLRIENGTYAIGQMKENLAPEEQ